MTQDNRGFTVLRVPSRWSLRKWCKVGHRTLIKNFLTSSDILCADMSLFGMNQHSHVSQCIIVVETTTIVYLLRL